MWRCNKCGNNKEFHVEATVSAVALMDAFGNFKDWHNTKFENPIFFREGHGNVRCANCGNEDIANIPALPTKDQIEQAQESYREYQQMLREERD